MTNHNEEGFWPFDDEPESETVASLRGLSEQISHLIDRAKYYGEGEHPPQEFIEIMQDLLARTNHIIRRAE